MEEETKKEISKEKASFGWAVLGFFIPIAGFIIFLCNLKKHKNLSKKAGIGALVGAVLPILFIILLIMASSSYTNTYTEGSNKITIPDFSTMTIDDAYAWCDRYEMDCTIDQKESYLYDSGELISQIPSAYTEIKKGTTINITYSAGSSGILDDSEETEEIQTSEDINANKANETTQVSKEYQNALSKANSYANSLHMSKQGVYDQLISEYGEGFTVDAAEYAINNVSANWNYNALKKAESYSDLMHMSKKGIYNQLISEYGEQFEASEAQYAIDHLED